MKRIVLLLALLLVAMAGTTQASSRPDEVKRVIYLIGDGMGLAHLSLMEIEGGYAPTAFDRAERISLITTRSANNRVTDSAAAGTALATGRKVNNSVLGITPDGETLTSMMELAHAQGKAAGLVVTCYLQHATPGAFYANVASRGDNEAITEQLMTCGFEVLMGGGWRWLNAERQQVMREAGYRVTTTLEEAEAVEAGPVLLLAAEKSLPKAPERGDYLPRATRKALELLSADEDGFVLMVEGSQIDGAGHANDAAQLLAEMRDFEQAVAVAMDFADRNPGTLVVVTADHETGGLSMPSGKSDFTLSESGIDYRFGTGSHTAIRVPAYFYGTGADCFAAMMDNTELAKRMMELMGVR